MILKKLGQLVKSYFEKITLKDTIALYKIKNKYRSKKLTPIMETLTLVGSGGAVWGIPILIGFFNKKTRLDSILTGYAITQSVITNSLVSKVFFHRVRPCHKYPEEYLRSSLPLGYSFPSGHALTSFTAATIFILSNPVNAIWALPLATSISFSRAYLFVHYPTDILAGAISGVVTGIVVYKKGHQLFDEKKIPLLNAVVDLDL